MLACYHLVSGLRRSKCPCEHFELPGRIAVEACDSVHPTKGPRHRVRGIARAATDEPSNPGLQKAALTHDRAGHP